MVDVHPADPAFQNPTKFVGPVYEKERSIRTKSRNVHNRLSPIAEDASRLLLARELTLEEKREFVDLRIEGWLRTLSDALAPELRREWSGLREVGKDELTLDAIQRLIALEKLRGSKGA